MCVCVCRVAKKHVHSTSNRHCSTQNLQASIQFEDTSGAPQPPAVPRHTPKSYVQPMSSVCASKTGEMPPSQQAAVTVHHTVSPTATTVHTCAFWQQRNARLDATAHNLCVSWRRIAHCPALLRQSHKAGTLFCSSSSNACTDGRKDVYAMRNNTAAVNTRQQLQGPVLIPHTAPDSHSLRLTRLHPGTAHARKMQGVTSKPAAQVSPRAPTQRRPASYMRAPTQGGLQVACRQHGRRSAAQQQQASPGPAARHP